MTTETICDTNPTSNTADDLPSEPDGHQKQRKDSEDELPVCRICHCSDDSEIITVIANNVSADEQTAVPQTEVYPQPEPTGSLITPCFCSGSLRYVHHYCLQQWIRSSNHKYCELCKFHFKLTVKSKPLHKVSEMLTNIINTYNSENLPCLFL